MRNLCIFLTCLILIGAATSNAAEVTATLEVVPDHTLPGIPVSFRLTVTNSSSAAVQLPKRVVLAFQPPEEPEFAALWQNRSLSAPLSEWFSDSVPPRATRTIDMATDGSLLRPDWFDQARCYRPGHYAVQILLGNYWVNDVRDYEHTDVEHLRSQAVILSSRAALTVDEPQGVDAVIWQEMVAADHSRCGLGSFFTIAGQKLAARVVKEFPSSAYAGWFATTGTGNSEAEKGAALIRWLRQAPTDSYTDLRRLHAAVWEIGAVHQNLMVDPAAARRHIALAREVLTPLNSSGNGEIRRNAEEKLRELRDLEQELTNPDP